MVQREKERISPPIQSEETTSSMPIKRESPNPTPTATVQTGQTAETGVVERRVKRKTKMRIETIFFILF